MDTLGTWIGLCALALAALAALAAHLYGPGALAWALRETGVSLALARSIDGRHALALAWGLRRTAQRLRKGLNVTHDDPAQRAALLVTLRHFTGAGLSLLLRRMHILIATGDNDRVRALNRQLEKHAARWATLGDGPERRRLDAAMAQLRQQMEESRRTSRAWVDLIHKLEQTGAVLKSLERDLALYGVSRAMPFPDFRRRLEEISAHIRHVEQARQELEGKL
jgi:hypothetical protein